MQQILPQNINQKALFEVCNMMQPFSEIDDPFLHIFLRHKLAKTP